MAEGDPISGSSRDYGAMSPNVTFSEFSPAEVYNLSESVANKIVSINSDLKSLEKMIKNIGTANDSVTLRDKIHTTQQSTNSVVSATARDLQRLAALVRRGDKPQRLQVERMTQAFKDALAGYGGVQSRLSSKMAAHMPRAPAPPAQYAMQDDEEATLIDNQQTQARELQHQTSMLLEKETYMNKIESDILDVSQIMQDLAGMVSTQGQTVDSVASHIEAATSNVEAGVDELAKAAEYQRRYRRKMFFLSVIGIVIAIILIVWIVKAFR